MDLDLKQQDLKRKTMITLRHDPGIFRFKNMVWFRTDKCAGTYFSNLFMKWGFKRIQFSEIRDEDKIFAFLINPAKRRVKAIVQAIYNSNAIYLLKDANFCRFLSNMIIADEHTYPYHFQFKHTHHRTVFLPLDHAKLPLEKTLKKFFHLHCRELWKKKLEDDTIQAHKADDVKKKHYELVEAVLAMPYYRTIMDQDIKLYNETIDSITENIGIHLTEPYV